LPVFATAAVRAQLLNSAAGDRWTTAGAPCNVRPSDSRAAAAKSGSESPQSEPARAGPVWHAADQDLHRAAQSHKAWSKPDPGHRFHDL